MPIDLFTSVRSTALITLVAASFSSPILVKSEVFAAASARLTGGQTSEAVTERVVAGGVEFAMPAAWGALGSTAAVHEAAPAGDTERIGTIVSGLCPGGSAGSACSDDVQLTFVAYSGVAGHELPSLNTFEHQLDERLADEFAGFARGEVRRRPGADGIRYLDYAFSYRDGRTTRHQRIAAFRHVDGSGVVALATGAKLQQHSAAIGEFLASSREPGSASA